MPDDPGKLRSWLPSRQTQVLILTGLALTATGAVFWYGFPSAPVVPVTPGASASSAPAPVPSSASIPSTPVAPSSSVAESGQMPAPVFEEESDDAEPRAPEREPERRYSTVQQAAAQSCTTKSVDGLSRQIIAQARCMEPNAFVPLPNRPNLVVESNVFAYLELQARNQLVKALDSKKGVTMTVNSALRTVAQQYLVWRWSAGKRCGVTLATRPGESNHEIGSALDIAEAATWRATLEAHDFKWLGASDRVHFDFTRSPPRRRTTDVLAFQKLWNRNTPKEKIPESGRYDAATEAALKRSPANGFAIGSSCGKR